MKKLLIIILCFTMIPAITVFAAFTTEEVDYTYTITNDKWFNLTTGVLESNVDYNTTNRIPIKYDSINLSSLTSFHHLLFFNHNEYLGYYNSQGSDLEIGDKFLGQINTFTPTIPANATHFVIQNYNNYKNLVPISELNNHTLKEIFENRNLLNPNLTGKTDLGYGKYLLGTNNGVTITYNVYTSLYTLNGTPTTDTVSFLNIFNIPIGIYSSSIVYISGTSGLNTIYWNSVNASRILLTNISFGERKKTNININSTFTFLTFSHYSGTTYDNYKFKLQLEIGSEITPYQVPTNGPYNQLDISTLGLNNEQMDYWYSLYVSNLANDIYSSYIDLNVTNPNITYIYQKEIPDNTLPIDKLENFMDDLGLGSKAVKLTIAIGVIATTMILLVMVFKSPALIVIIAASLELVLFVFMGWIPNYVIIVLAVLLFILIIKERSGNNEA